MSEATAEFTVVVCTRDRPEQVARAITALRSGTDTAFPIVVVDQSRVADPELAALAAADGRIEVLTDTGRGLSRARNLGLARAATQWLVYVDDDCLPEADWAERLREVLSSHPEAALVSGDVPEGRAPGGDYVPASAFRVDRERHRSGRFTHPGLVAFGVCFAVRRDTARALGGWDERLGPGVPAFPAADDMDFNYRLLRSGAVAFQTPAVRAVHEQWRPPSALPSLYRGYLAAWSGFAMKHLRQGDVLGGMWLWAIGAVDAADMLASAASARSRLRLRIAGAKIAGLLVGTARGLARRW